MKQHKKSMLFKLPPPAPVSLKQIEKFLQFSFKTVGNFSSSKLDPLGQRKLGENPTPGAVRTCESSESPERDGQTSVLSPRLFSRPSLNSLTAIGK